MYIKIINKPNNIPETNKTILFNPETPNDNRNKMVDIINPVFLIS